MKKFYTIILTFILCFTFIAPQYISAAVKISKTKATLEVGSTLKLKVSGTSETVI